ncbi:MAG TPA: diphthine synthase [Candidatus Nanoarchaeia archaeon]|nr:diphthine synthase [Candidatus Nanoarchaeia archaeon]
MLHLIGLGLTDEKGLTIAEIDAIKSSDEVIVENYTSVFEIDEKNFEKITGKKIKLVSREFVEDSEKLISSAKKKEIALLVSGDPLSATTHYELLLEGKKQGVEVKVYHNASVFSAIAATGFSLYKFGATASIPNPEDNFKPESFYEIFVKNKMEKYHTLFLIDPNEKNGKRISLKDALKWLLEIDSKKNKLISSKTTIIACSNLGRNNQKIVSGNSEKIKKYNFEHPCCFVIPGELNFKEEEALQIYS